MAGNDKTKGAAGKRTPGKTSSRKSSTRAGTPPKPDTAKPSASTTASSKSAPKATVPTRHSAPTRKPVTIDAEATNKPAASTKAASSATASATSGKTGPAVPKPPMPSSTSAKPAPKPATTTTTANSAPASATAAPTLPRNKTSGVGILPLATAALLGGVVAIGGAWLLGILGNQSQQAALADRVEQAQFDTVRSDLDTRIAAIEQREPTGAPVLDQAAIDAAVDARLAEVTGEATASGPDAELLTRLQASLAAATARVETLEGAESARAARLDQLDEAISSGSAGETAGLAAITTQSDSQAEEIAALQEEVGELSETVSGSGGSVLETVRAEVAAAKEALGQSTGEAIAAVEERIAALDTRVTDASATAQSAVQASQQGVTELREQIATLQSDVDSKLEERDAASAEQIASLTDRLDNGADKIAARALAAAALKRDVDQGEPFAASLATLKSVAPEPAALAPLDAYAETGVPQAATLRVRFDDVSDAIIAATAPPVEDAGIADRLFAGARNLVKVRSLEAVEGDGPGAIVSQIASQLDSGDLQAASDAWSKLPEAGQAASKDWHDALTARILAEGLVADTVDSFLQQSGTAPVEPDTKSTDG